MNIFLHPLVSITAAFQGEGIINVYDAETWSKTHEIEARQLRWTITDTAQSPDGRYLLYSSINSTVHMVDISDKRGRTTESIGNVTELHEALELTGARGDLDDYHTGVWSLQWSPRVEEVVAGTADCCLYVYNIAEGRTLFRIRGHDDHVNAVEFLDTSGNLIATGGDDSYIKASLNVVSQHSPRTRAYDLDSWTDYGWYLKPNEIIEWSLSTH